MYKPEILETIRKAIRTNPDYDFQNARIENKKMLLELDITADESQTIELLEALKAYQRLIRIIPKDQRQFVMPLMEQGFHSAFQIAGTSKTHFMETTKDIWGEDTSVAELIHNNALHKRSRLVMQYMNELQNNEPHAKAARI